MRNHTQSLAPVSDFKSLNAYFGVQEEVKVLQGQRACKLYTESHTAWREPLQ